MSGAERRWRPIGFILLMLGLGLRLDSSWQGLAWLLIVAGAASGGAGLWLLARGGAFVTPPRRE